MPKYIILDTETTGTADEDRIIQLGYMVLDGQQIAVHNEYCSAELPIKFEAMEAHGITPDMIEGKPPCIETTAYKTLEALNLPENIMLIHNAPFDLTMLKKEGFTLNMALIDTLKCAKHLFPDSEYHRLQYFRYALGIYKYEKAEADKLEIEIKAHDAIGDVLVLKLFLSELMKKLAPDYVGAAAINRLIELTQTPVLYTKPLKFGKHKGKTLEEIKAADRGYLEWMLGNMADLDEDMRYSIGEALK